MVSHIKPRLIRIEASSRCQLMCPVCPTAQKGKYPVIGKGDLTLHDFVTLLDQNPFVKDIELSNYGEMFLNPELVEIMEGAYQRGVRLRADNGVNFNHVNLEQMEGLVRHQFRSLTCSIDGTGNETYQQYRINGDYDRVISNIRSLNRIKKEYRSRFPILTWQFVVFGFNQHEIPKARELAGELGMLFYVKLPWGSQFSPPKDKTLIQKETGFASRKDYRKKLGLDMGHLCCRMLWEQPQINWDGRILGCPRNFWDTFGGNAFTDGLLESINFDRIQRARLMLMGKIPRQKDLPCSSCQVFEDRVATGKYVRYGVAERFFRSVYHRTKVLPPVRAFRYLLRRKGI